MYGICSRGSVNWPNSGSAFGFDWFWLAMFVSGWPTRTTRRPRCGCPADYRPKHGAETNAGGVDGGKQRVRVGVAHVHVHAPAAANHVLAVTAQVIGESDARLPVVGVVLRILAEVLHALDAIEQPGPARGLHLDEVRVLRLVELVAVDQVVAQAEVQRQLVAHCPVVLDEERILLQRDVGRRVAAVEGDRRDRPVQLSVRCAYRVAFQRAELDVERRLVDEVHAGLEVVADAAHAGDVPGEVVAELPFLLLRALRCVRVLPDGHAVGEGLQWIAAARRDVVEEVGVLEDELIELVAAEHPVVVEVYRVEVVGAVAPVARRPVRRRTVRLCVLITAVTHGHVLRRCEVGSHLDVKEGFLIGRGIRCRLPPVRDLSCSRFERYPAACARPRRSSAPCWP